MASVMIVPSRQAALASPTVRQFSGAVGLALLAVGGGVVLYGVEKYLFQPDRRFVENPASVMMRAVGLAHFWVGWVFLFTSPRLLNGAAALRLGGLTLLGAALCLGCAGLGRGGNPILFLLFYGYFLVHEVRDETNLYLSRGEAPPGEGTAAFLPALQAAAVLVLVSVCGVGYLVYARLIRGFPEFTGVPPAVYGLAAVALAVVLTLALRRLRRQGERCYGSLPAALSAHRPLVTVYLSLLGILTVGLLAGSGGFNLLILIHAGSWLLFVRQRLAERPPPARLTLWAWLRHTPAGFVTLHVLVVAFVLALMALRVHAWQRVGLVSDLVAGDSFPYWSLMHISMSFWRPAR